MPPAKMITKTIKVSITQNIEHLRRILIAFVLLWGFERANSDSLPGYFLKAVNILCVIVFGTVEGQTSGTMTEGRYGPVSESFPRGRVWLLT